MKTIRNQTGITPLFVVILAAIVIGISFAGYTTYKAKNHKSATATSQQTATQLSGQNYIGIVTKVDCAQAGAGCTEYVLQSQDTKSYNLTGQNFSNYVGKTVKIYGQLNQDTSTGTIKVTTIDLLTEPVNGAKQTEGTLKGQVFCTIKVGEDPCQSSFTLTYAQSPNPNESVSDLARAVQSDLDGRYSINLTAGSYNITPAPKTGYPVIVPIANPITISAGQTTTINISYMDGTR